MMRGRQILILTKDTVLSKPMLYFVSAELSAAGDRWFSMLVSLMCFEILMDMRDPFSLRILSCKLRNF
jgi:hypothetical protein